MDGRHMRAPAHQEDRPLTDHAQWVHEMAQVMQAKRERRTRRTERILDALRQSAAAETMDDEGVFL